MLFADRRFAPSIFATTLLILGVAAFVRLGIWQLDRAEEKQALIERYEAGRQTTVDLTAATVAAVTQYQHVRARGHYDPTRQILLDNMPSQHGRPGYRVITPFELDGSGILLVDRGWVPMGTTRNDLPAIQVGPQSREIAGRYDALPRAGIDLGMAEPDATAPWPRVMSYPQQRDIESALGRSVLPGLVLLDAQQTDGYEREWQTRFQFGPERHLAYAVQWFALATAAIVIYLIVSFRRKPILMSELQVTDKTARNSRLKAWVLVAAFFAPLLLAFLLYYGGSHFGAGAWRPAGSTNRGDLVHPARPLPAFELTTTTGAKLDMQTLRDKWNVIYIGDGACDERCREALVLMRQTRLALNDDMTRVQRLFLATANCCDRAYLDTEHAGLITAAVDTPAAQQLLTTFPDTTQGRIFIVDPLGNLMMSYGPDAPQKGLLEDLKKLLKLSHIG